MIFNTEWLNKSENKSVRNSSPETTGHVEFVVWHGTDSPNPSNTPATLNWALTNDGKRGAAHYYIPQHGLAYFYIDPITYIAWHAGAGGSHSHGYYDFQVNVHSVGIEIEERFTKKPVIPATPESLEVAAELALEMKHKFGIPLNRAYHVGHKEIVRPGYRYDPATYSIDKILERAMELESSQPHKYTVDPRFVLSWQNSGGIWKPNQLTPGLPRSDTIDYLGKPHQMFERGVVRLDSIGITAWLLLDEIETFRQVTGL